MTMVRTAEESNCGLLIVAQHLLEVMRKLKNFSKDR
jgi:hypothetical protein